MAKNLFCFTITALLIAGCMQKAAEYPTAQESSKVSEENGVIIEKSEQRKATCNPSCAPDEVCISGMCLAGPACLSGEIYCNGMCRDLSNDEKNCGRCNLACATGDVCILGECHLGATTW